MSEPNDLEHLVVHRGKVRTVYQVPDKSYRDLYEELATLRQEMAEAKAELARSMRRVGEHDEPCPFDNPAPTWQGGKCVKPRGHETHWNGQGDVWRVCIEELVAERDAQRDAMLRVVQLVTHGADGLVVGEAIAEMRRVLDGGGK